MPRLLTLLLLLATTLALHATLPSDLAPYAAREPDASLPYVTRSDKPLHLQLYKPADWQPTDKRPAIVLFFGGGFKGGGPGQFKDQLSRLARLGLVGIGPEYRTESSHGTTPVEAIRDGMAAIRYLRTHATELGIDPDRIIAGGGSAGGLLAAVLATTPGIAEDPDADTTRSYRPNALVLFNPGLKATPYTETELATMEPDRRKQAEALPARFAPFARELSPLDNIRAGLPPTLIMIGTEDFLLTQCQTYSASAQAAGNDCELRVHANAKHGFFNFQKRDGVPNPFYYATLAETESFLTRLGHLHAK